MRIILREDGKVSFDRDSSLGQSKKLSFSREDRCRSPFPSKDFISQRLEIPKVTREIGSNRSFSKVLTISSSPPIPKLEREVRCWRPHSATGVVILTDLILIVRNLGGRQAPLQNGKVSSGRSPRDKLSREIRVSIGRVNDLSASQLCTENDWRVDERSEELSEIKMDSRFLQPLMERSWSVGKPSNGKEVSV